jgi:hypothetical protein
MSIADFATLYTLTACLLITGVAIYAVRAALAAAGWEPHRGRRGVLLVAALLTGWLAVSVSLGWQGIYAAEALSWPRIQYGILLPIVVGFMLYRYVPLLRDVLHAVPQGWLIGIQTYRAVGVIFLILMAAGDLPGVFALPAGLGDIAVGAAALSIAIMYRRDSIPPPTLVIGWNAFGIADLLVAVATGFISSPSPLQVAAFGNPNQLITEFGLVLVPTFAVPLSILLHLASLAKVRAGVTADRTAIA